MRFRKSTHAVYNLEYHIVWTPRYRRKIFVRGVKEYLEGILSHLEGLDEDIEVKKVNVRLDHVHLVLVIPPRVSVAQVVQYMKSRTGKALSSKFKFIRKAMHDKEGMWSRGYCVSSIGLNEKTILRYVEHQEREDKGQLKLDLGT
jgi:putative transposase